LELDVKGLTHRKHVAPDFRSSVDKIDPARGYVKGNVQLLHQACNRFKGEMSYHMVYGLAKNIVRKFKALYPEVEVDIEVLLRLGTDGRNHPAPGFQFTSSGRIGRGLSGSSDATQQSNPLDPPEPPTSEAD
jgi:hypothetical protein